MSGRRNDEELPGAGASEEETLRVETPTDPAAPTPVHPSGTTGPIDNARFIPGDIVAGRYRIAGLLGRGGMGEVYRADDLRLSQAVALKFLDESLARDGAGLARFHREVSTARQISHRHVCRVYDIGEHAGMHFLSMEYIRGEELSSLLKRIGRLPMDKAIETARQLCGGLAAIHAAGVLHRDLKPANIMLDEHGDVRITDFGIVALAEGVSGGEAMIGTPAYMSPEQRSGGTLTTRSDLYSLGLVFHEFFTGKRPSQTTTPSVDLDPAVERVIRRCLEPDPARRPASALQVAAALPGGDPLAAALAAGETPSPEMVAAAPKEGSLRPMVATGLLVWTLAAMVLITLLSGRTLLHRLVPLERSPELLQEDAARIARMAGYTAPPLDSIYGFEIDDSLGYVLEHDHSPDRWQRLRAGQPSIVVFWYRQSPRPLEASDNWMVTVFNPPNDTAGMIRLQLDPSGRLLVFEAVPPQVDVPGPPPAPVDWPRFFTAAGLDPAAFRRVASQWTPPLHNDTRAAWSGFYPGRPDLPLRIEAASYRGKPTWFELVGPWSRPSRQGLPSPAGTFASVLLTLFLGVILLTSLLAWKNLRLGRGDRRGAFRLALFVFAVRMLGWLVSAHHVPTFGEVWGGFLTAQQSALYWACLVALLHLALEPFVRRRWPEWIISWSRLLAGDVRDPLVGRDVLIGGAFAGVIMVTTGVLFPLLPAVFGLPSAPAVTSMLTVRNGLLGVRGFVSLLMSATAASLVFPFIIVSVLLFFAKLTRNNRVAIGVSWLVFYVVMILNVADHSWLGYVLGLIIPTVFVVVLTRYGVLALVSTFFFNHFLVFFPITTELSAWYATSFLLEAALVVALMLYGFRTSLAGQRLVGAGFLDD
jgi:serine/threonine-protein kinase